MLRLIVGLTGLPVSPLSYVILTGKRAAGEGSPRDLHEWRGPVYQQIGRLPGLRGLIDPAGDASEI